jgi:23S rRNA pseudouridine1911/1915/1917 synthase
MVYAVVSIKPAVLLLRRLQRPQGWCRCVHSVVLTRPTVIYHDNHLLVLHKPPGWHSVPNEHRSKEKCLLNYCKENHWGGGSQKDFLRPLHRLDQPCSGLQLYGKTTKAASRIQSQWKGVQKTYICVLEAEQADFVKLQRNSSDLNTTDGWHQLEGYLDVDSQRRSVRVQQQQSKEGLLSSQLQWKLISEDRDSLAVAVRTLQGRRHMIRALFSQLGGCPLAGDMRYGARKSLPDQSVALHAYRLQLPPKLRLGSLSAGQSFVADIPKKWQAWFGLRNQEAAATAGYVPTYGSL